MADESTIMQINEATNRELMKGFMGIKMIHSGQITIGKILGRGAFGEVFQGIWREKDVAIKQIDFQHAKKHLAGTYYGNVPKDEHLIEILQWEIHRLSSVSHANIVSFYGLLQNPKNEICIVMEFCHGGTLDKSLEKNDIAWSKRCKWSKEITQGLKYLHKKGILHRDLKAENILIDENGTAKLADLGVSQADALLSKKEARLVQKGFQDTRFIAPENRNDPTISSKETDIYALGLVLWQIAAGKKDKKTPLPRRINDESEIEIFNGYDDNQWINREIIPEN